MGSTARAYSGHVVVRSKTARGPPAALTQRRPSEAEAALGQPVLVLVASENTTLQNSLSVQTRLSRRHSVHVTDTALTFLKNKRPRQEKEVKNGFDVILGSVTLVVKSLSKPGKENKKISS